MWKTVSGQAKHPPLKILIISAMPKINPDAELPCHDETRMAADSWLDGQSVSEGWTEENLDVYGQYPYQRGRKAGGRKYGNRCFRAPG